MVSQVNIYVLDIVWILSDDCVEVKIHGFIKRYVWTGDYKTRLKKYHVQCC